LPWVARERGSASNQGRHAELLEQHTRILTGHSETLAQLLEGQKELKTGQAAIMRHLGI
jgi:hypothetical protein